MDCETQLRNLTEKWRSANFEVSEVCRNAAEELHVKQVKINMLNDELNYLRSLIKTKFDESMHNPNCGINGWGKGKDE